MTRVVVAQPEPPADIPSAPLVVGVLPWAEFGPHLAVIAKLTLSYAPVEGGHGDVARWAGEQLALSFEQPSAAPGAGRDELYYPSDFIPRKSRSDVLLVGHAHSADEVRRIDCRIRVAKMLRSFTVRSDEPQRAISLSASSLVPEGETVRPVGPRAVDLSTDRVHAPDHDFSCYNAASYDQRLDSIPADAEIELSGLSRHGATRRIALPNLEPQIFVSTAYAPAEHAVELRCDTLWIDTDSETIVLLWRGDVELQRDLREVNRLVVALESRGALRDGETRLSHLQRGHFGYAVTPADLEPDAPPIPSGDVKLKMARLSTWGVKAPEPKLSVTEYATISAELAETKERRPEILASHDFDEDGWTVEERCWLEKMASAAMAGDAGLATEYSDAFVTAQDALISDPERATTLADFAALLVEMERTADVQAVLERHEITLAMWMRSNRRWAKAAEEDASVARELEETLAKLRSEAP